MCGIVGVLAAAPIDPALVVRMRDTLAHRGPDHAGLWRSEDGRVCLGHRRLSIIDLDARAHQPFATSDGVVVVTFNGEIYNYRSVRKVLESEGVRFRTESDTEVLVESYRRWGDACVDRLSGMFAFALWDASVRRLFCARDRAGEKPFHYALVDGAFLFASEIKALREWPGIGRAVDYEAMIDFLTLGFVADPKTIWSGIRKLAPAHAMTVEWQEARWALAGPPRRYWSLDFGDGGAPRGPEDIRGTLLRAADEMAVADVPLGAFLSGGVDSSSVVAALTLSGHRPRSFTIGFAESDYDERDWARQVAVRYGTLHSERTVHADDVVAVVDRLAWHYDEPFNDYSSVPTFYLCREARKSITVALSGDGADELFAGYRKYQRLARRAQLDRVMSPGVARAVAALAKSVLPVTSRWQRTIAQYAVPAAPMLADMLCNGLPLSLLRQVARGPVAEALRHYDPCRLVEQLLGDTGPGASGLVDAMRRLDFALTLPGDMLVKIDRASMAVGLEVRPLFLHREVMELAARTSAGDLVTPHGAKIALKEAVRPWLTTTLVDRRKQGFAMPLPRWLAHEDALAIAVRNAGREGPVAELLDMQRVHRIAQADPQSRHALTAVVHSAFVLDNWFRRWHA